MLSVAEVAAVLGISRAGAYELARSSGFPALKIDSRIKANYYATLWVTLAERLYSFIQSFIQLQVSSFFLRFGTTVTHDTHETVVDRATINQKAEEILEHYGNSILRLAYSYLHNMADAKEVLQDTLIQYLKTAPSFEKESHENAWFFRVAGNLSKNRIDYNRIRSTNELNEALVAEQREDLSFVWDAVKMLPVKYREVIHLFYYEDIPTAQIAQILQEKESTVRSRLMRGREKLKPILKEAYDFE